MVVDIAARPAQDLPPRQCKHRRQVAVAGQKQRIALGVLVNIRCQCNVIGAPLLIVTQRLPPKGQHAAEHRRKAAHRQPQRPPGQGAHLCKQVGQQLGGQNTSQHMPDIQQLIVVIIVGLEYNELRQR